MPVVARIEVWEPDGTNRTEIGVMVMRNQGHVDGDTSEDPDYTHYHYEIKTSPALPYDDKPFEREGVIEHYPRKQNLWQLVRRVLDEVLPEAKK